jgi:hypothetical protein
MVDKEVIPYGKPPLSPNGAGNLGQDLGKIRAKTKNLAFGDSFGKQTFTPIFGEKMPPGSPPHQPKVRPMAKNFSRRCRRTVSRSSPASSSRAWAMASPVEAIAAAGSRWAPPDGSVTI